MKGERMNLLAEIRIREKQIELNNWFISELKSRFDVMEQRLLESDMPGYYAARKEWCDFAAYVQQFIDN